MLTIYIPPMVGHTTLDYMIMNVSILRSRCRQKLNIIATIFNMKNLFCRLLKHDEVILYVSFIRVIILCAIIMFYMCTCILSPVKVSFWSKNLINSGCYCCNSLCLI